MTIIQNHLEESVVTHIKFFMANCMTQQKDIDELVATYPRPWFSDEEDAFNELQQLQDYINNIQNDALRFDAIRNFLQYEIAFLFLEEAPTYVHLYNRAAPDLLNSLEQYISKRSNTLWRPQI